MCKETEVICLSCSSTITIIDTCSVYKVKSAAENGISHRNCQRFKPNVQNPEYVQKTDKEFHMCDDRRAGSAFPFSFLGMRSEDK
ncbi:uncharacterized protein EAE97_001440 [Botrytis byssoidea]|uniref:Uncharacterized protein n=1 Tax=Botrytis byssoidea TaxID=139641 RepID=A0A9P5IUI2_9HELO|nr:uncharacterized protein EAE97_001440 [Botrytis byssoidea]KAF7954042.1 hypothetical protein EAE97_001440 [Botrytis byssoidea]